MDNRVMMITTTQRQIEREAEKEVDAAQTLLDHAVNHLEKARLYGGLDSVMYRDALRTFDRARSIHDDALDNLERTAHDDPDT